MEVVVVVVVVQGGVFKNLDFESKDPWRFLNRRVSSPRTHQAHFDQEIKSKSNANLSISALEPSMVILIIKLQ